VLVKRLFSVTEKIWLERDDLRGRSRICRHRRWMTESGGRIDRDVARGLG
jgi:hypothetical protein